MPVIYRFMQGIILIAATVFIHATGAMILLRQLRRSKPHWERHQGLFGLTVGLTWVVGSLVLLGLLEVGLWAFFYDTLGALPDIETSVYYSLATYTTVGYGDVVMSREWRLMGTSEALVGILMTAWSTALLIGIVNKVNLRILEKDIAVQADSNETQR